MHRGLCLGMSDGAGVFIQGCEGLSANTYLLGMEMYASMYVNFGSRPRASPMSFCPFSPEASMRLTGLVVTACSNVVFC